MGLTGGIGSGKSTVSSQLATYGAVVVDADLLAREVVEPGTPGLVAVVEAFGAAVLGPDGRLDRAALGSRVFADPAELARLNAIVHPLVRARTAERVAEAQAAGPALVVHDVPLLVETGGQGGYDEVVVVDVPVELQVARLVEQRGLAEADARARIARQASREQRLAVADVVLHNDGSREDLRRQVAALWARWTGTDPAGPDLTGTDLTAGTDPTAGAAPH